MCVFAKVEWAHARYVSGLMEFVIETPKSHKYRYYKQCYYSYFKLTRGQSNLTKSASRGAHSPVRGHTRGSKVVPLNSWGRVSY